MRELALHILDVAENSLEAGASLIQIQVMEDTEADVLIISVTDDGRGMDHDLLSRVLDPFVTTRKTRRLGLGLPLFAAAAEHCNGSFDIRSEPGKGTELVARFQHSHIDRAPLGDMAATLMALILGNQGVELAYTHQVDGKTFSFSTAEIKQELGDVPITLGPVVQWLRDFLAENLDALYSVPDGDMGTP